MKQNLTHFLLAAMMAVLGLCTTVSAADVKTIYAMSDNGNYGKGIYTLDLGDTISNIQLLKSLSYEGVSGGLMVGDTYYYLEYQQVYNGYKVLGLYAYDMESQTLKRIADYGEEQNGTIASCFSYDYQSSTMYGLNTFNGGTAITKIDLTRGIITNAGTLTYDALCQAAQTNGNEHMHVMTSTYDGDFYGISYWGALYKINPHTAECQYIGTLDYNPGQAFMYTGDCLFYDNDTDQLYLRYTTYNWTTREWLYEILKIDKKTAHVTRFATVPEQSSFNAITVPFTVAEASAPAKVQNLKLTRGAAGQLTATLDWDNPSKTYGRGGTLEDLDYVLIYRDGVLVDSIANPAIGGHQSWTDDNIAERGYYTYKLVCGNDMGRGDRASVGSYIGNGNPLGVTNLTVERDGDGAMIKWTAPTEGKLNSYIDTSSLNYDVVRFGQGDATGTKVASAIKENEYTDNAIQKMDKYTYALIAHTATAVSDTVKAEAQVLGPAFTVPTTFAFDSVNDFYLWTTIDANGNSFTWDWTQGYYGSMQGVTCYYCYDQYPAADWLISPRVKLEAGKRYKLTFDALSGSKKIPEVLAVSLGQGVTIADQDSINQFDIVADGTVSLRTNLPQVSSTGDYNFGFLYRSNVANYKLTIGNIQIAEDHEGYIEGYITCGEKPVADATVIAGAGQFTATTDATGHYRIDYVPQGETTIQVIALGYEDASQTASVTEYETTQCNISLTALPTYSVSGKAVDCVGDAVCGAAVTLSGYDNRETTTDQEGHFTFTDVYKSDNYSVSISKNKLLDATKNFAVSDSDIDLGNITLQDNHKPAGKVSVATSDTKATVEWKAPANDAVVQRIDDGTLTTAVGINGATSNTMFGVVKREAQSVSGVQFYIDGTSSVTHYSVQLNIFDLDDDGNPTSTLLYQNSYVPATDGQWNSYTLPAPVDAPRGYYLALSYYDYLLVGIDGDGDADKYPFVEYVNCFTPDYTTGNFLYLDDQSNEAFHHNFLIRPIAAPFTVPEDSTEFTAKAPALRFKRDIVGESIELQQKDYADHAPSLSENAPMKTPQSRQRYNVYRMKSSDIADESKWTLLSEKQQSRSYDDSTWPQLEQGVYAYAVKAVYTGGAMATASVSDTIGNKMLTQATFHITTNTPDNEALGAKVTMINSGGLHVSSGTADASGDVVIDNVWKGAYDVTVSLDGFKPYTATLDLSSDDAYSFSLALDEDRITPFNLIIDDEDCRDNERKFIWNYPDLFEDDFESHDDFAINSPGSIGWQYIDGDGATTGAIYNYTWDGICEPMAYMVFNASATEPSCYDDIYALRPYSGNKCLTDWAAYLVPNDDWIITPKLHFTKDFKFSFYAASYDYYYTESFEVLYSTTDANPESFIAVQDSTTAPGYWMPYSYDIPKEAKYVAIHCISNQMRIFRIDDIRFGLPEAMTSPYYAPHRTNKSMHSPSKTGLYEVYLDGKLVAQQDGTEYTFTGLTHGQHTAGVVASYTSGKTEMSTIDFSVDLTGITTTASNALKATISGNKLTVSGLYDSIALFTADGKQCPLRQISADSYDVSSVPSGVCIVNISQKGKVTTVKAIKH